MSYSDASLANLDDGGTQGGFINLVSNDISCALLAWQSHKIHRIVRSTLAAEIIACIDGADSAFLLASQIQEITGRRTPIICISDCKSSVSAVKTTKTNLDKRLRVDIGYLRTLLDSGDILDITWTDTKNQIADSLTKCSSTIHNGLSVCFGELPQQCRQYKGDIEVKLNKPRQSLLQLKQYKYVTNMIHKR